jgi:hypothetical protein
MFMPTLTFGMLALSFACVVATPTTPTASNEANIFFLVKFDQNVDLVTGQEARVDGTDIVVKLLDAHGPRPGCLECPIDATLNVRSGSESRDVQYSFSDSMLPHALDNAKRKTAFDLVFVAVRVSDAGLTVRVERPEPE